MIPGSQRVRETQLRRWLIGAAVWTAVVLFQSTRLLPGLDTWPLRLEVTAGQWFIWAFLLPVIIRIDKLLPIRRDAMIQRLLFHIPASVFLATLTTYLSACLELFQTGHFSRTAVNSMFSSNLTHGGFHFHVLIYWVIVGVYTAYDYHQRLKDRQLKTAELEKLLSEAKLHSLQQQLHPHFLFNALNTISAYVEDNPRSARRLLEELGELLRLSLRLSNTQETSLSEEIAFVEKYINLQKARFGERLHVTAQISSDVLAAAVPTFILEPLVENAIRHGISQRPDGGVLQIRAWQQSGFLHLRVCDDGPGFTHTPVSRHAGIGLTNTRERLRNLYGDRDQSLTVRSEEGSGAQVDIVLPFRSVRQTSALASA